MDSVKQEVVGLKLRVGGRLMGRGGVVLIQHCYVVRAGIRHGTGKSVWHRIVNSPSSSVLESSGRLYVENIGRWNKKHGANVELYWQQLFFLDANNVQKDRHSTQ